MTFAEAIAHINFHGYRVCNLFQHDTLNEWQAGVMELPPCSYIAHYKSGGSAAEAILNAFESARSGQPGRDLRDKKPTNAAITAKPKRTLEDIRRMLK